MGIHQKDILDELDKKVIRLIQGDLPLEERPFDLLAKKIGMTEDQLIKKILELKDRGVIRRFGATLRHQEAGFGSNAMVAWKVPEKLVEEVGEAMARFREVSHCYQREPQRDWRYNLFTMIHGENREACHRIAGRLSEETGIMDYALLFSEKEYKKTSMAYF